MTFPVSLIFDSGKGRGYTRIIYKYEEEDS